MCTILSPLLSDFFSSLFPCGAHSACNVQGSPLKCESQGVLRLAACGYSFYGSVLCAFSLGLWQMLDADGWCLLMVLYMVLSHTLADRSMARRQQVCWKGCFTFTYFYWDISGLLQVGLFLVAVHVIFPFVFCLFGRERESQARRCRRCGKTSSIQAERERMPLKMKATCTHMLASRWKQPATHACKQVFTNTRQQATMSDNRKTKNQVKNNRWIL